MIDFNKLAEFSFCDGKLDRFSKGAVQEFLQEDPPAWDHEWQWERVFEVRSENCAHADWKLDHSARHLARKAKA